LIKQPIKMNKNDRLCQAFFIFLVRGPAREGRRAAVVSGVSLAFVIFCYNFVRLREQFSKGPEHPATAAPVAPSTEQTHNPGYRRGKLSLTVVP